MTWATLCSALVLAALLIAFIWDTTLLTTYEQQHNSARGSVLSPVGAMRDSSDKELKARASLPWPAMRSSDSEPMACKVFVPEMDPSLTRPWGAPDRVGGEDSSYYSVGIYDTLGLVNHYLRQHPRATSVASEAQLWFYPSWEICNEPEAFEACIADLGAQGALVPDVGSVSERHTSETAAAPSSRPNRTSWPPPAGVISFGGGTSRTSRWAILRAGHIARAPFSKLCTELVQKAAGTGVERSDCNSANTDRSQAVVVPAYQPQWTVLPYIGTFLQSARSTTHVEAMLTIDRRHTTLCLFGWRTWRHAHMQQCHRAAQASSGAVLMVDPNDHPAYEHPDGHAGTTSDGQHETTRIGAHQRCPANTSTEWLVKRGNKGPPAGVATAAACAELVLAQPASECSRDYFFYSEFADRNCKCVPPGARCEADDLEAYRPGSHGEDQATLGSTYRITDLSRRVKAETRPAGFGVAVDSAVAHMEYLGRAWFSIQPEGDSPSRKAFYDSLATLTIPVMLNPRSYTADLFVPFAKANGTIFIHLPRYGRNLTAILEHLETIPVPRRRAMQQSIAAALPALTYPSFTTKSTWSTNAVDAMLGRLCDQATACPGKHFY